ncbi:MAG: hypothetical protein PHT95_07275 [Candidatus Omnitrophica bacterium]|nr:hypothetical protein [Candidatus Omnitrophota bacterium]MDD4012819.1 hypothetical protein [Candidatus Omnitrophota bacterium]
MLKKMVFLTFILFFTMICSGLRAHAQSLEDIKAQIRRQVKDEYGASQQQSRPVADTERPGTAKETLKKVESPKRHQVSFPLDAAATNGLRLAFLMIFFGLAPAGVAKVKGRSFMAWWTLGTLFFIFALPAALIMKPLKSAPQPKVVPHQNTGVEVKEPSPKKNDETISSAPTSSGSEAVTIYQLIEQLAVLKQKGLLTEEEFKSKKNDLLGRI